MARSYFSFFLHRNAPPAKTPAIFPLLFLHVVLSSANRAQSNSAASDQHVRELYAQAKAAESRGDLAAAALTYESLLQISPRLAPAYNNLGSLYLRLREYKKASTVLEKGLKIDPKMISASALLGIARYEMGDYHGARAPLESALHGNASDGN